MTVPIEFWVVESVSSMAVGGWLPVPIVRAAHLSRCLLEQQRRRGRLAADPSLAPHGSVSTYRNWGCRCAECTVANTVACRAYNARVLAERGAR